MVNTIGWIKGKGFSVNHTKAVRRAWMRTDDKTEFECLEDYHNQAMRHFGSDFEVKSYEYKKHYAVRARRIIEKVV